MRLLKTVTMAALVGVSTIASAYDCNSDCSGGGYSYPCPSWNNPGKMCHGDLPNDAACMSAKAASCQIWEGAVGFASGKMKPLMVGRFNSQTWNAAVGDGKTDDYMVSCVAAGVAACGALGTELGGPWGGVISGALGTFVSFRACQQSKSW